RRVSRHEGGAVVRAGLQVLPICSTDVAPCRVKRYDPDVNALGFDGFANSQKAGDVARILATGSTVAGDTPVKFFDAVAGLDGIRGSHVAISHEDHVPRYRPSIGRALVHIVREDPVRGNQPTTPDHPDVVVGGTC